MSRSSTSSSDRWPLAAASSLPLAALLAAALLLAADAALLGPWGAWQWLSDRDGEERAKCRLELARVREAPPGAPRAFVIGTSRVQEGFDVERARRELPGVALGKLGQPRFEPFVIRQLVDDLLAARADSAVILLSDFDTHRPLRLEPVPDPGTASLGALVDLLRLTGARFAIEQRTTLYRLLACSALYAYRYRTILTTAGFGKLRTFRFDERFGRRERGDPFRPIALWGGERHAVAPAAKRSTFDLFPPLMPSFMGRVQAGTIGEMSRGPHVRVQQALVRSAIEHLSRAGVRVAIVEAPLHPAAADLAEPGLRAEFLAFVRSLEADFGIGFVPLESAGAWAESDFVDLVHVGPEGAAKLTGSLIAGLRLTGLSPRPGP